MKFLITGGAGFTGINAARGFIDAGHEVIIFDNFSRGGCDRNLDWLREQAEFELVKGDVRDFYQVRSCFFDHEDIDAVLHLAGQVAVTSSVINPREDFENNALGTFNVCEVIRQFHPDTILLYSSSNKVYGPMKDLEIVDKGRRYEYKDLASGISEKRALDFYSPYGCSKGAGDQYVIDYARIYGLRTAVFRQSCIYGPHQFGMEDQGWVAWFVISAVLERPITIFGDGKQTRDILYIDDLIDCYLKAAERIDDIKGSVYNIGGGGENVVSLLELISMLEGILGKEINYEHGHWRPGDQKTFVCDVQKAYKDLSWKPKMKVAQGIKILTEWVKENKDIF